MRSLKYHYKGEDREVRLSEQDYKILLNRFDLTKVKGNRGGFIIRKPCICKHYKDCEGCPFSKKIEDCACLNWVKSITEGDTSLFLSAPSVEWLKTEDKEAREAITKLREAFLGAD